MDEVEVSTVVYLPAEEVYEFLTDFPGYARYSKYLREVRAEGDGSPGTRYDLTFAWWKLTYTATSEVTSVDPPRRIDWRLVSDFEAEGHWRIEPDADVVPPDREHACRVWLTVEYDPGTVSSDVVDLPRLVSLDWVVEKVKPLIQEESRRIVERIVADIEGERRDVDLTVRTG